jgi:hypothetical protein
MKRVAARAGKTKQAEISSRLDETVRLASQASLGVARNTIP